MCFPDRSAQCVPSSHPAFLHPPPSSVRTDHPRNMPAKGSFSLDLMRTEQHQHARLIRSKSANSTGAPLLSPLSLPSRAMPPEALAPSTPTSSSIKPGYVTRKFLNDKRTQQCYVCKMDILKGSEMQAEVKKFRRPGIGAGWHNERHYPSCRAPCPVSPAPSPVKLEFGGDG